MPRILVLTLIGLTVAIGLTVGMVAWRVMSYQPVVPDLGAADPSIGYAFYSGLDDVLTSGDRSALDRTVGVGFVDHSDGQDLSADEMVDGLTAFGTSFPGTRIQVLDIQAAAGTLVASVAPFQLSGASVAGVPVESGPISGGFEVLRVHGNRVTERWSEQLPQISLATFSDAGFNFGSIVSGTVRLEEISLPEDGTFTWQSSTQNIVMMEQGQVRIDGPGADPQYQQEHQITALTAGDVAKFTTGGKITMLNDGNEPAQLLLYSLSQISPTNPRSASRTLGPGATLSLLWASNLPVTSSGSWHITAGQVTVPGNTEITLSDQPLPTMLLASEGGGTQISLDAGTIMTVDSGYLPIEMGLDTTLGDGHAGWIEDANSARLTNSGETPATIWIIAIDQAEAGAIPAATPGGERTPA